MSSDNQKNLKSLSYVKCQDITHEELMGEATNRGANPTYFVGWVLDEAVAQGIHKLDNKERSIFWKSRQLRQIKENRDYVRKAAIGYLIDPTDEGAEVLADMCESVGLGLDEVLEDTKDDRFSAMKATQDSVNVERADWLYRLLAENGGELTVKYIYAKAGEAEYSKDMVTHTRKYINGDSNMPSIVSVKHGKEWIWQLRKEEGGDEQLN